jgi:anti-sigma-K factor RskA
LDPKSYIASGILEHYVLGKLSAEEEAEVENFAQQYPEIRQEIGVIEKALEEYALLQGRTPPPGVLTNILQTIEERDASGKTPSNSGSRAAVGVLALLLAAALVAWFLSYQNGQEQTQQIADLEAEMTSQQESCDSIQVQRDLYLRNLEFLQDPDTRNTTMQGTELSPDAIASVYFNPEAQTSYLNPRSLPVPPSDKQYQLWAIVDGTPVSMGVFDTPVDTSGLQEVPYVANAQAYAVTLEPRGGSETPTLEQMYVVGEI